MVRTVLFSKVSGTYESQWAWSFAEWDPLVIQSLIRHLGISLGKINRLIWNLCFLVPEKGQTSDLGRWQVQLHNVWGLRLHNAK